ncbi:MAG: methyltransferase domain-containing protein [Eubacterium sp.]|nr:methyltransferase domain-containing protein [Eubacterium sp.]
MVSLLAGLFPYYCVYRILDRFIAGTLDKEYVLYWCLAALAAYLVKVKRLVKALGLKNAWSGKSAEEIVAIKKKENEKNRIPRVSDPEFEIIKTKIMGCPVIKMIHKRKVSKANLFIIGGGMVSAPRPGSIKKASFSKTLCENNAAAEEVSNTSFEQGDAVHLDFEDETFDAVTSNYVYHNVVGADKQELLLETLRVLKKGGCFAIHDIMSKSRYGDMQEFAEKLRAMGYEEVKLIPTDDGLFMSKTEAKWMGLTGSTLLVGKK